VQQHKDAVEISIFQVSKKWGSGSGNLVVEISPSGQSYFIKAKNSKKWKASYYMH
jgi:hypothetical protein